MHLCPDSSLGNASGVCRGNPNNELQGYRVIMGLKTAHAVQKGQGLTEQRQHREDLSLGSFAAQPDLRLFSLHPILPGK